ncbi:MAG: MGMT family protein [bacterium]|nr:MGMT family protein [bacterium]
MSAFRERVLRAVSLIPKGQTRTYKQIAETVGSPRAYRAVGSVLKENYDKFVPCHRVIRESGETGEYNRGATRKRELLKREGVL